MALTGDMTDAKGPRDDRWYLSLMSPNTKGPKFAWLDPTSIYINAAAFSDLLDDLIADLKGVEFDVVGGCDAMGFVLGAGLAARCGKGSRPARVRGPEPRAGGLGRDRQPRPAVGASAQSVG